MDSSSTTQKIDLDLLMEFARKIGILVATRLAKTRVTPNQITIANFILFVPSSAYLLTQGVYLYNLISLLLIVIAAVIDFVDGSLARLKSTESELGHNLDIAAGCVWQPLLYLAITLGAVNATGNNVWYVVGLVLLLSHSMSNYIGLTFDYRFGFRLNAEEFNDKFNPADDISFLDSYFKNVISPKNPIYTLLFTSRYWIILAILINFLQLFLAVHCFFLTLRWMSMYWIYFLFLDKSESALLTIRYLREIDKNSNANIPPNN